MSVTSLIPDSPRPLGREGQRLWDVIWSLRRPWIDRTLDIEHVAILCESMDERQLLRLSALKGEDWRDRVALRNLDAQIMQLMGALALNPVDRKALSVAGSENEGSKLNNLRVSLAGKLPVRDS